ncbi:MAG: hypothetical protein D6806_10960 [Deltaproteobacteria bacterium]|nr:MAG: hypothetical protein D6806_10960 [Deltaproteobacteria bacterium]
MKALFGSVIGFCCATLLAAGCDFKTPVDPSKYWPCGQNGYCPKGCTCLDDSVCVPEVSGADGTLPNPVEACRWCPPGLTDCDGSPENGCEADLSSDPQFCGSCSNSCGVNEFCVDGACAGACPESYDTCGVFCVDTKTDPRHCGACGNACEEGLVCADGKCVESCPEGLEDCGGSCVDTSSNPRHCGECGNLCSGYMVKKGGCKNGVCEIVECVGLFEDCDGDPSNGCEADTTSDSDNCGKCGTSCNEIANSECSNSRCQCAEGWANCDSNDIDQNGCETNLLDDPLHCGSCDTDCVKEFLDKPIASNCVRTNVATDSPATFVCCINGMVKTLEVLCNDGGCNEKVRSEVPCDGTCTEGRCYGGSCLERQCNEYEFCGDDGKCHCGDKTCGNDTCCPSHASAGLVCVDTLTDDMNCGTCGNECAGDITNGKERCIDGSCVVECYSGYGDCNDNPDDGCETNLIGNDSNCGACGVQCAGQVPHGVEKCDVDTCVLTCLDETGTTDYEDCDGDSSNGCETSLWSNESCGGCEIRCGFNQSCAWDPDAPGSYSCMCLDGTCDANGDPSDGCEGCVDMWGNCGQVTCAGGQSCCGNLCLDLASDPNNCGRCGNACQANTSCLGGVCGTEGLDCRGKRCGPNQVCCLSDNGSGMSFGCYSVGECMASSGRIIDCDDQLDCAEGTTCCYDLNDPLSKYLTHCRADCLPDEKVCRSDADCEEVFQNGSYIKLLCKPGTYEFPTCVIP